MGLKRPFEGVPNGDLGPDESGPAAYRFATSDSNEATRFSRTGRNDSKVSTRDSKHFDSLHRLVRAVGPPSPGPSRKREGRR